MKEVRRATRKRHSAEEKIRTVLAGCREGDSKLAEGRKIAVGGNSDSVTVGTTFKAEPVKSVGTLCSIS